MVTDYSYTLAVLPRAGLGNKLITWSRAYVFSYINELPLYVSPWEQLKIGHLLRGENDPRLYLAYFRGQKRLDFYLHMALARFYTTIYNPPIRKLENGKRIFVFNWDPQGGDYFNGVRDYRDFIKRGIETMASSKHLDLLEQLSEPLISIHIRRGDFREVKTEEEFGTTVFARTPLSYFINLINQIRKILRFDIPVNVFSDANITDLKELIALPNVIYTSQKSALVDMLLMAKSKILILSADSSFGYWAAFLSNAAIIHHPKSFRTCHRSNTINQLYYEGTATGSIGSWPELLISNIKQLK